MPRKPVPFSETHTDAAACWMGNVDEADGRFPYEFTVYARLRCWWWCGKPSHRWFVAQPGEFRFRFSCPECRAEDLETSRLLMERPVGDVQELVAAWQDERPHDGLRVRDLCGGVQGKNFGQSFALRCSEGHKVDTVVWRFLTAGCPYCRGTKTRVEGQLVTIAEGDPEVAATWHPTRNGDLTPQTATVRHRKPIWWKSVQCCDYEWEETLAERQLGRRPQVGRGHYYCPRCESVFGSLAWVDPELATEWHEDNDLTPWHVKPFSAGVVVKWRCSAHAGHVWEAAVSERSAGRLCPSCSTAGTSKIEKAFLAAAQARDPEAAASRVGRWRVDVLVPSLRLVIEYDGEYWHAEKHDLDLRKTEALVEAGYLVARVRENDLSLLDCHAPRVRQVSFRPAFGSVGETVEGLFRSASGGP